MAMVKVERAFGQDRLLLNRTLARQYSITMSRNEPESSSQTPGHHNASTKQKVLKILTAAQRYSAPFLSIFVGIHLAAPIAASLGGSELSTSVMVRRANHHALIYQLTLIRSYWGENTIKENIRNLFCSSFLWVSTSARPSLDALSSNHPNGQPWLQ